MKFVLSLATTLLLALSAQATTSQPIEISVNPGSAQAQGDQYYSYNFGTTQPNRPLYTDFTLTNNGPAPLAIQHIGIAGMDFAAYFNCPSTLPPQSYCTIRVRFDPWNEGYKDGRLVIRTNEGIIQIRLTGWSRRF